MADESSSKMKIKSSFEKKNYLKKNTQMTYVLQLYVFMTIW